MSDTGGGTAGDWSIWNTDDSFRIRDENTGADRVIVDSSGNVGIGTSSPGTPLHVEGAAAANNLAIRVINTDTSGYSTIQLGGTDAGIYRNGSAQTGYGGASSLNLITVGAHPIAFSTSNTPRVIIDGSGNVGIGTSSPSYLTHLYSTSAEPKLVIEDASSGAGRGGVVTGSWGGNGIRLDSLGAAGWVYVGGGNTSYIPFTIGTEKARFHSNGNFGIGTTSPSQKLAVGGSASGTVALQVTNSTAGTAFNNGMQMFINDTAGGLNMREAYPLQFYVNGAERMRITSSGNVGIGQDVSC